MGVRRHDPRVATVSNPQVLHFECSLSLESNTRCIQYEGETPPGVKEWCRREVRDGVIQVWDAGEQTWKIRFIELRLVTESAVVEKDGRGSQISRLPTLQGERGSNEALNVERNNQFWGPALICGSHQSHPGCIKTQGHSHALVHVKQEKPQRLWVQTHSPQHSLSARFERTR